MKKIYLGVAFLLAFSSGIFAQEADMSFIPYREGDLWGYATPDKLIAIKPQFEQADFFYEGFAAVKKGGKFGYINKEGKVEIPFKYFTAKPFKYGYYAKAGAAKVPAGELEKEKMVLFAGAAPQSNGYEICINTKGVVLPRCPAIAENSVPEVNKQNTVTITSNYSTIQKSNLFDKIVDDYKMPGSDNNYYIAIRDKKYGVFNKTFEVIVPFEYTNIKKLTISIMPYLIVEKDSLLSGVLFGNGSPYLAVENTRLNYIEAKDGKGYFIFTKDGKTGVKNTRYQEVVPPVYENITYDENGGFILTGPGNAKGYCFLNQIIVEPKYTEVSGVKGGKYIYVKTAEGKYGYINENGVLFFSE